MPSEQKRKVILVADDDPEDQELLEEAIIEADQNIEAAKVWNGKEVLEYLENCTDNDLPCAILLDYSMPFLSGAQVLAILCNSSRFKAIPKFVWSTSNTPMYIKECLDNGAINYFIKPDSQEKLDALAKEVLAACKR